MVFNPQIPNNELMLISEKRLKELVTDINVLKQLNNANKELLKLEKAISSLPNPRVLLDFLSIPESVESNAVENIHTTIDEAFQAEATNDPKTISKETKETLNYKEALLYGFKQIKTRGGITTEDIKKINSIIVGHASDFYSSPDKKIKNSNGKVLYTPPQGIGLINQLMDNFCKYFNITTLTINNEEEDILLLAPLLHYQFEAIHPFGDGNGRVGRILLVLFLVQHNILSYPILFLSQYIHKLKTDYYTILRSMDELSSGSLKELTEFILAIMEIQGMKTKNTVQKIEELQEAIRKKLITGAEFKRIPEILEYIFMKPYYSVEGLRIYLDIHRNTASSYLATLVEMEILVETKVGRRKLFYFPEYFALLSET